MSPKNKKRKESLQTIMSVCNAVRPVPSLCSSHSQRITFQDQGHNEMQSDIDPVKEETSQELAEEIQDADEASRLIKSEVERFVEISKYFSSPLRRTASYICENRLVAYPNPFRIEYKRRGVTTRYIQFSNLTLEPVFIKLYKVIPDLEQLKFINLNLSRCKRIPPGLSFRLGINYDDVEEKASGNAKLISVATRNTLTPCYQICEIDLIMEAQKSLPNQ